MTSLSPAVAIGVVATGVVGASAWSGYVVSVAHAAFGDDVVGEMLNLGACALQGRYFHAVVVVEMNVKRRHREIVVPVIVLHQAARQIPRGMIVDVDQRGDAFP